MCGALAELVTRTNGGKSLLPCVLFSFRMMSDIRIECRNANSQRETARFGPTGSCGSGLEPGSAGAIGLDGFWSNRPPNSTERGIIAPMKASLWLNIVILVGASLLQAQTAYHPGQVIHVSVTFDGPYVVKIKGVQVVASIPTAPDSQPGFKTEMFFTESKPTGPNTFDVSYRVPDNQASGDYPLKQIRASVTDSSLTLFYESEQDFTARILKIENVQSFVKPKIKDVQVP